MQQAAIRRKDVHSHSGLNLQSTDSVTSRRKRVLGRAASTVESLERRQLLAAAPGTGIDPLTVNADTGYVAPGTFLYKTTGYLTKASRENPLDIALNYVRANPSAFGLLAGDVQNTIVVTHYADDDTGTHHISLRQTLNGFGIENAEMAVAVTSSGRILSVASNFVRNLPATAPITPALSVVQGLRSLASNLKLNLTQSPRVLQQPEGRSMISVLSAPEISNDDIPAQLHYVATTQGVRLAWEYVVDVPGGRHWYGANVDAQTGRLLYTTDYVSHFIDPEMEDKLVFGNGTGQPGNTRPLPTNPSEAADYSANYNVYPIPLQSPSSGGRSVMNNPWDLTGSPYGWHDTDGDAGGDSNVTTGNNVSAQEDRDNNNTGGIRASGGALNPDGTGTLTFDNPINFALEPTTADNQLAAITNLYYWNNLIHDIHYRYGFTEAARNFQLNNYGNPGIGNDAVQGDAQDGSGTNNANFASFTDGTSGRMQMFLFTAPTPDRDGDFDAQVIIHEYGHGVSNRVSGSGAGITATQSRGMGEGWGDWWGLMLLQTDGSIAARDAAYPVGTYVLNQPLNGPGIRRVPYSYNSAINSQSFALYGTGTGQSTQVHNTGELWVGALWDANWLLIEKYGFNPNVQGGYGGTPAGNGNTLMLQLVMNGLKLHGANPSFLQARDGILAADVALTGGANQRELWTAFARRGLGASATTTGSSDTNFNEAFDLPTTLFKPFVQSHTPTSAVDVAVSNFTFNFSRPMNQASFSIVDDIQSFTGPGGNMMGQITGATWVDSDTLRVDFTATRVNGNYSMTIGPNIVDTIGDAMDQDGDDTPGEPQDAYTANFTKSGGAGPRVTGQSPSGSLTGATLTQFDFTFGEAMDASSFDVSSDVQSFFGPGGTDLKSTISGFSWLNSTTLRITFPSQSADGTYTVALNPTILAAADGAAMDQNSNGTPGEPVADRYSGAVSLDALPGPDAGGYEASPIAVQNIDLVIGGAGVTTLINGVDDSPASTLTFPAGNTFTFYGTTYTSVSVTANGLIGLGATASTSITNSDLTTTPTHATIAALWDDWRTDATASGGTDSAVLWTLSGNNLIIEWSDVPHYISGGGSPSGVTYQAILSLNTTAGRNGDIIVNYPDLISGDANDNGASASVGIKAAGTQGTSRLLISQNSAANPFVGTGRAIRFTATRASGTVFADDNGNGVQDGGEAVVPFARIYNDVNNNLVREASEANAFADQFGNYVLSSLTSGTAYFRIDTGEYINTQPGGTPLAMGENLTGANVGVFSTALVGTPGADSLIVTPNGAMVDIALTAGGPTQNYSILASVLTRLSWDGLGGGDTVVVNAGPSLKLIGSEDMASLSIGAGNSAFMPTGTGSLLVADSVALAGTLDLGDNDMILDYSGASQLSAVEILIATARNGGSWNGASGITSSAAAANGLGSTTLGAIEASDYATLGNTTFGGEPLDGTMVLVKYTYYGDADFNGVVDFDDYVRTDSGYNSSGSGWFNGDFDQSGVVDFDDYVLLDLGYNLQGAPL